MKNLRLLNAICNLVEDLKANNLTPTKNGLISDFKGRVKTIMQYSSPNIGGRKVDENFNEFIKEFLGKGDINTMPEIGDKWIGTIKTELENQNATYPDKIGEAFNNLFDFEYVAHKDLDGNEDFDKVAEDINILYQVSARHISYMLNAFDGLRTLPQTNMDKIINKFFEQVVEKSEKHTEGNGAKQKVVWNKKGQGWGQAKIEVKKANSDEKEEKSLDANTIKSEAGKFLGDFQDKNYTLNLNPANTTQLQTV